MTVKLIKQKYLEAREMTQVEPMDLIEMVTGTSECKPFSEKAIESICNKMRSDAEKLGATHVFGVEFRAMLDVPHGFSGTIGYGDAYKLR